MRKLRGSSYLSPSGGRPIRADRHWGGGGNPAGVGVEGFPYGVFAELGHGGEIPGFNESLDAFTGIVVHTDGDLSHDPSYNETQLK